MTNTWQGWSLNPDPLAPDAPAGHTVGSQRRPLLKQDEDEDGIEERKPVLTADGDGQLINVFPKLAFTLSLLWVQSFMV